jgi:hypothetical protein
MLDDKIAKPAMETRTEGPGYDLVSLGLVVLTLLLVGVWTTHFFRHPPPGLTDFDRARGAILARHGDDPVRVQIELARWADFHLRPGNGRTVSMEFVDALRAGLEEERKLNTQNAARGRARRFDAIEYARGWARRRSDLLAERDRTGFDVEAHVQLVGLLEDLGMPEEAAAERGRMLKKQPGW